MSVAVTSGSALPQFPANVLKPDQREIERPRRELARMKAERDILRKAESYFAGDPISGSSSASRRSELVAMRLAYVTDQRMTPPSMFRTQADQLGRDATVIVPDR